MQIIELGANIDYEIAWARQRELHAAVADGAEATVLLLEHASVYTAGTRTSDDELPADGTPVVHVDRGGKITWHGPGQLVAYPIVRLPEAVQVVDWVRRLEEAIIRTIASFGLQSGRVEGRAGVWVSDAMGERKVAQIGVRVARATSMHGIAINVACALDHFERIVPCGIRDAGVSTLAAELGHEISVADVAAEFAAQLEPLLDFAPFTTVDALQRTQKESTTV